MWKPANALIVTEEQRRIMEAWVRAKTTPQRVVLRSRICLLAADGVSHNAIAKRLNTSRPTVLLWTERFRKQGAAGLSEDAPHGPSSRRLNAEKVRFGEITRKKIRRGVFRSVPELVATIEEYIRCHNENPKPFIWTKRAEQIVEKLARCKAVIETLR